MHNEKRELVFIILHYMAVKDTLECISSIKQYVQDGSAQIIAVDNASPDDSGRELAEIFKDDPQVTVLRNTENLGFARGNNTGISYALAHYDFDFCVVCNNDTLLLDEHFCEVIRNTYSETGFAVMGPMILTADGRCDCSPARDHLVTMAEIEERMQSERNRLKYEENRKLKILRTVRNRFRNLVRMPRRNTPVMVKKGNFITMQKDIELHGCFLIFSRKYFEKFDGFYDKTFLYNEEQILHLLVHHAGLLTVYQPELKIYHKEDASTNIVVRTTREKKIFTLRHSLKSLQVLKDLYEEIRQKAG